jgi:hypothetical protein
VWKTFGIIALISLVLMVVLFAIGMAGATRMG